MLLKFLESFIFGSSLAGLKKRVGEETTEYSFWLAYPFNLCISQNEFTII